MTDSTTIRAVGGDPHYTRMCAADLVSQVRALLQPMVDKGVLTDAQAIELAEAQYNGFRQVMLRLAWFYFTSGQDEERRSNRPVPPPKPILPVFSKQSFPPVSTPPSSDSGKPKKP